PHLIHLTVEYTPPPPLLHSFPTRRSSDLPPSPSPRTMASMSQTAEPSPASCDSREPNQNCSPGRSPRTPKSAVTAPNRPWISFLDRKSTRLNSSHEWISYAVFCLKKKTKI